MGSHWGAAEDLATRAPLRLAGSDTLALKLRRHAGTQGGRHAGGALSGRRGAPGPAESQGQTLDDSGAGLAASFDCWRHGSPHAAASA